MMSKKSITFLLFNTGDCPGGGIKIILEHANRLVEKGHQVHIVYPASLNWRKGSFRYKLQCIYIYFKRKYFIGYSSTKWFNLNNKVKEHWTWSLNFPFVPSTDIYIATEVRTSEYLNKYPINNSRKFYFIQDYENWFVTDDFVKSTYHYPLNKIVITKWLYDIINKEEHEKCTLVPNAFDFTKFRITIPIENKDKFSISILYHWHERKDLRTTIRALEIVKKEIPQIKVVAFGTSANPNIPDWFNYYCSPDEKTHLLINNQSSIYVGASKVEGFGLTIGEAMLCGQAVVCTNNKGYLEMAENNETALVSEIEDSEALANNIIKLIIDDNLRWRIAHNGYNNIQKFNWNVSSEALRKALNL